MAGTRFIPVDEVIATALTILPDADDRVALYARQWAYIAQREIGAVAEHVTISEYLPVVDFSIKKPEDMYKVIDIGLYTATYAELQHTYQGKTGKRIHNDTRNIRYTLDVSDDSDYYYISSNATTCKWCKLRYFKFPVDKEGLPMIPETNVNATIHYILYMMAQRRMNSEAEKAESYTRWLRTAAQARGKHNTPSQLDGKRIAQEFSSMIDKSISKMKYKF